MHTDEKKTEWQNLMQAVNEVKKIEIDLDRATVQCNDLNKKIIGEEDQQKVRVQVETNALETFNLM